MKDKVLISLAIALIIGAAYGYIFPEIKYFVMKIDMPKTEVTRGFYQEAFKSRDNLNFLKIDKRFNVIDGVAVGSATFGVVLLALSFLRRRRG